MLVGFCIGYIVGVVTIEVGERTKGRGGEIAVNLVAIDRIPKDAFFFTGFGGGDRDIGRAAGIGRCKGS